MKKHSFRSKDGTLSLASLTVRGIKCSLFCTVCKLMKLNLTSSITNTIYLLSIVAGVDFQTLSNYVDTARNVLECS